MDHQDDKWFQVSVKGLVVDDQGCVLLLQERDGRWDFVGGRVQKGEDLREALVRECQEELGLGCRVLDAHPTIVYSAIDLEGRPRLMLFYKILLESLDFVPSDECVAIGFFSKDQIATLPSFPQTTRIIDYL